MKSTKEITLLLTEEEAELIKSAIIALKEKDKLNSWDKGTQIWNELREKAYNRLGDIISKLSK